MTFSTKLFEKDVAIAIDRARAARDRSSSWLLAHIDKSGKPSEAEIENGWYRLPWALSMLGEFDTAVRVVSWAESSGQFDDEGDFALGMHSKPFSVKRVYGLSNFAIGAHLAGRYSVSTRCMDVLASLADECGGYYQQSKYEVPYTDLLSTSQVGITALAVGDMDRADAVYRWIANMMEQQPDLDRGILYQTCQGNKLITEPEDGLKYYQMCDFNVARQSYFMPGIVAAFLAGYGQRTGMAELYDLSEKLLTLNKNGTNMQYENGVVQICKYGWGIAALLLACPKKREAWIGELVKMAHWFADCQNDDGSWSPSTYITPSPSIAQKMIKTAEHAMEVTFVISGLASF